MRVHTKVVIDMASGKVLEDEFYEYDGEVADAKGGGGGGTQVVENKIPAELKPLVGMLSSEGMNLYQNYNPQYYPGSTVAPMSDYTQAGLGNLWGRSQSNMLTPLAESNIGSRLSYATPEAQQLAATTTGAYLGQNPYLDQVYSSTGGREMERTAAGDYLGANPYLQNMYETRLGDSLSDLAGQFSMAGRSLGSGSFGRAATDRASDLMQNIYGGHYEAERGRQQQAASALQNLMAGQYESERGRQQQAAQGLGTMMGQTLGLTPSIGQMGYGDIQKQLAVGQAYDAYNQGLLGADIDRFNWQQNLPYMKMDKLASALHGANIGGGTQTTSGSQKGGSNAAANIGAGLMAASSIAPYAAVLAGAF